MNSKWLNIILLLFVTGGILIVCNNAYSQVFPVLRTREVMTPERCNQRKEFSDRFSGSSLLNNNFKDTNDTEQETYERGGNPTKILTYSLAAFLYIFNPTFLYENNKINSGITKEISLGFGYFGEYRIAFEYSFLFRELRMNHFRIGFKYDNLTKNIQPSNILQTSGVFSYGMSYFTDLSNHGLSPEMSYGYSIRNHKILIYPHIKLRYTYLFDEYKSNILDFSFGIVVGIANPFIDLKIRRN
ncbi:MAG: hypothetical protein JW917_00130 [Ignavibacteria bacterium]|nr:hypothetical protein [Ignavibacteria bacterium]